jgi:hypothetical protein
MGGWVYVQFEAIKINEIQKTKRGKIARVNLAEKMETKDGYKKPCHCWTVGPI